MLRRFQGMVVQILERLPPAEQRQSLLFSATFPEELTMTIVGKAAKVDYLSIDAGEDDLDKMPSQIEQKYTVLAQEDMVKVLWQVVKKELLRPSAKVIVFFT